MSQILSQKYSCKICNNATLVEFKNYRALKLISSDLRPVEWQGGLGQCPSCGAVQKLLDAAWHDRVSEIYASYRPYPQGDAVEQMIFGADGTPVPRSQIVLENIFATRPLRDSGTLLDVGCGDGAQLRRWGGMLGHWSLYGADVSDHQREKVLNIPKVVDFFAARPEEIGATFDFISLTHVAEHLLDPASVLHAWSTRLARDGAIMVQLPDVSRNIFDLVIMDHVTHFSRAALDVALGRAGLTTAVIGDAWIPAELISVATRSAAEPARPSAAAIGALHEHVQGGIDWLIGMMTAAQQASSATNFGIFGTSVKGTWLQRTLGDRGAQFFVDEDPKRIGGTHLGRPILAPEAVPSNATVFMASAPAVARRIEGRLRPLGFAICLPPEL